MISGSCKTVKADHRSDIQFGNYVISGSCKTIKSYERGK